MFFKEIQMKKDSLILFFHGYGSSVNTDKFTGIVFTNKVAVPIDYDLGLKNALNIARDAVAKYSKEYEDVILVGHSMGGYVANAMSVLSGHNAVLISPSVNPSLGRPEICDVPVEFLASKADVVMLVEKDDECIDYKVVEKAVENFPDNYDIKYFDGGHHRINRIPDITEAIQDVGKYKYPVLS